MRVIRKFGLFLTIGILTATSAAAQYWPLPANKPGKDVVCTGCLGTSNGLLTPGYPDTISTFTGRFLDSQATVDFQQPFKTARAESVLVIPSLKRIYMQIGSAVFAYSLDTFFTRLTQNEPLMSVNSIPVVSNYPLHTPPVELVLSYDSFFYAENEPQNGWITGQSDGQRRLFGFDVDDQGYVYMAYYNFGWGIVKDDLGTNHNLMQSMHQDLTADFPPRAIVVARTSAGRYFSVVSNADAMINIYDVTDRSNPTKLLAQRKLMTSFAKTTNMDRVGVVGDGSLQIYSSDSLINGGQPLVTYGSNVWSVASDGTNFYCTSDTPNGLVVSVFTPSGNSYSRADYPFPNGGATATTHLSWGDGYLVWAGSSSGNSSLRVFKLQNGAPSEIDFRGYFRNYFFGVPNDTRYTAPRFAYFYNSTVAKKANHTYLIATGFSLGDVYEIPSADSVVVNNLGSVGNPNGNTPPGSPAGPFYGDPVKFTATTGAAAPLNITWDFGDGSTASGLTGAEHPVTHQYAGTTSGSSLTRTVKATSATDLSITSSVSVTLQKPTPRFGVTSKFLFVQPNASSPAPIVSGDTFFDASDGAVESHYNTWLIDGVSTNQAPTASQGVGACGPHSLSFTANYGPYTAPGAPTGTPVPLSITPFNYMVRPFAAAIDVTSDANNVTFTSLARASTDTNALSAAQAAQLSYRWELLDANNAVLLAGPTGQGSVQAFPNFVVAKQTFSGRTGVRAHLVISSPGGVGAGCANVTGSAEAYTAPLNAPDPVIAGGCNGGLSGGPTCTFTVNSATDQSGWTYAWNASGAGASPTSSTSNAFTVTFTQVGVSTITLTAMNGVGSTVAGAFRQTITTPGALCPAMNPTTVFVTFQNPSSSCTQAGGTCNVGETITFVAQRYNYDFNCSSHTFSWNFGDGSAVVTGQSVTHAFTASNSYNVQMTVNRGDGQTFTVSQTVPVGTIQPPPPPPSPTPPPPTPTGCGTMRADQNVFIAFHDANFNCTANGGNCAAGQPVYFAASAFGDYNFSCGTHIFNWTFGDGQTASNTQSPAHTYAGSGPYSVTCSISGPTGSVNLSATVKFAGGPTPPTPTPTPTPPPSGSCSPVFPGTTFFVDYAGPQSGCTEYGGDCNTSETLPLTVKTYNYDFACASHTFQWDFGDSSTPGTGVSTTHRYISAGAYALKVTITVNGQAYLVSQTVKVGGSGNPTQPPPGSTYPYDFTSQPLPGVANGYTFTAFPVGSTSTANVTFNWDFGDHQTCNSCGAQVPHIYADSNNYTVTLSVNGVTGSVQHLAQSTSRRRGVHH